MSFSIKLDFIQPAVQRHLPNQVSNNKTNASIVALPSPNGQILNGHFQSKFFKSNAVSEPCPEIQIQALANILHGCKEKGSAQDVKSVHGVVLKTGFAEEDLLVLFNHVLQAYLKCSDFNAACRVFERMSSRNIFSWTVMIVGSKVNGYFLDGFKLFCEMQKQGILPDGFAYSSIVESCIGLDCLESGKIIHSQIVVTGFAYHSFVSTSLLNMYAKLGKVEDACQVFDTMRERNRVSWNAMISGFLSNGFYLEAFDHFLIMKKQGYTPNMYTLISVLKAVGKLGDVAKGKEVHNFVCELGMESNILVGTALIDMYSKCGCFPDARSVFDMNNISSEVNTPWNAMIAGYTKCGYCQEALEFYVRMCQNNVKSDLYTYCSVFNAVAALKSLNVGRAVHAMICKSGCDLMVTSINNAIADAYSKCGSLEDVRKVFDRMKIRDIVSWTTLMTAYSQSSEEEEALAIFSQMREEGFIPNEFTFSSVLVACASLCWLDYGRQVHGLLCKAGLNTDKCIESALVDMYAKCGSITEARKVFDGISNVDIVSWTAIISGYAQHGFMEEALNLFKRMEQLGIKANAVTLLCVLFACSHGGMVEEGLHYFQLMERRFGLVPEMEHYGCVVDLLGRAGRLDDALEFVRKMPIKPNEMVWQTLLGACRVHGNIELGEIAAQKILSSRPECSATYVLLSNTYIETGSLEDGLFLRNVMKKQGVRKEPGYSWIPIRGRVHKFLSGDQNHPQKDSIYVKLDELNNKITAKGYIPDLRHALKDDY